MAFMLSARNRILLALLIVLLALLGTTYGLYHAKAAPGMSGSVAVAPERAAVAESPTAGASASASGSVKPIRFVKNPESAPPLDASDILGKPVTKANWDGRVVLVNFWATWCPPCREEIPELLELQKKFPGELQIIGISEDDDSPEKVLKFAQLQGMNYPIVMSTPKLIASYGGVPALPTSFLIDTKGRVVTKHSGLYPIDSYVQEIRALLGQPTSAPVETFTDTGQLFLKNAANATELPGVDFTGLTPDQKKLALRRLNAESCTCGCGLTISQCRVNDTECPVSGDLAANVIKEVAGRAKPHPAGVSKRENISELR
jgi:thiol-disulfide isomerase/thioredoxin